MHSQAATGLLKGSIDIPLHQAGRCWRAQGFPSQEHMLQGRLLLIRARPCRPDGQLHLLMNLNLMRSKMPCRNHTQKWGRPHPCPYPPVLHSHSSVSRRLWSPLPTGQHLYPHSSETQLLLGRGTQARVLHCHQTPVCTWSVHNVPRGDFEEGLDSNSYLWFSFISGGSLFRINSRYQRF